MLTSLYIKKNPLWLNKNLSECIKKSNDNYAKQMIEYSKERKVKNLILGINDSLPPIEPNKLILSGIGFLSLTTIVYYFYSKGR
jgi:hypothetical protein